MVYTPTLSPEDADLFYRLWVPLLEFTNQKHHVIDRRVHFIYKKPMDPELAMQVSQYICGHTSCIDAYLKKVKLPSEHEDIVRSWKRCVAGTFFVERHLRRGTVFISSENDVYMVKGIVSEYKEMLPYLPVYVQAALLPFRDVIITDGLIMSYPIVIGSGIAKCLKDEYMLAKNCQTIRTSL